MCFIVCISLWKESKSALKSARFKPKITWKIPIFDIKLQKIKMLSIC